MMPGSRVPFALVIALLTSLPGPVFAHDGPPFPIVSGHRTGGYEIEVWTDPDSTDDGSAEGQFWVILESTGTPTDPPAGTRVDVSIRPSGTKDSWQTIQAEPVEGKVSPQFARLVMDHEGRFDVRVEIVGPLGRATATAWVDATYDLRPAPAMLVLYLLPFLVVGALWAKLLVRRHRAARPN